MARARATVRGGVPARSAAWEKLASTSPPGVPMPFYQAALIAARADAQSAARWDDHVEGGEHR